MVPDLDLAWRRGIRPEPPIPVSDTLRIVTSNAPSRLQLSVAFTSRDWRGWRFSAGVGEAAASGLGMVRPIASAGHPRPAVILVPSPP